MLKKRDTATTRRLILEAAYSEIYRHGFHSASLKNLLAQTGLTKGALYHHFPNKKALGYAVVDDLLMEMVEEDWLRPLETSWNPIDCLQERLTIFKETAGKDDLLLGCPVNNLALEMSPVDEGFRLRINKIYDRWREVLAEALQQGQERCLVRQDINPMQTATFIVASMAGCRSLAKNAQSGDLMEICCRSLVQYWDSLRA